MGVRGRWGVWRTEIVESSTRFVILKNLVRFLDLREDLLRVWVVGVLVWVVPAWIVEKNLCKGVHIERVCGVKGWDTW